MRGSLKRATVFIIITVGQYSKKRAYELGDQLGAFRNRRKESEEPPIS